MKIDVMTLFDEYMDYILSQSIIGRARVAGYLDITCHNIRNYATDKHHTVDDTPYGGGKGMLMMAPPVYDCYRDIIKSCEHKPYLVYMSPKGRVLNQKIAKELSLKEQLIVLCGHYEGIDQRVLDEIVDEELSVGDYVLTGGELAAALTIDCVCRMVPGVLADEECYEQDSHFNGLLEYPHYTRPLEFLGKTVPEVLLAGNHAEIESFRRQRSLDITKKNRPDMLTKMQLTRADLDYLERLAEKSDK